MKLFLLPLTIQLISVSAFAADNKEIYCSLHEGGNFISGEMSSLGDGVDIHQRGYKFYAYTDGLPEYRRFRAEVYSAKTNELILKDSGSPYLYDGEPSPRLKLQLDDYVFDCTIRRQN